MIPIARFLVRLAAASLLAFGGAHAAEGLPAEGPVVRAPSWSLQTPAGETVSYPDDAGGWPTVLMFWPSWCPFSRALQPYVQDIWEDYRDRGVALWTINIRETGDPVQAMRERGLSFPLLVKGDALMGPFHIERTPWLVVIDPAGRIVYTRPAHPPSPIEVAKDVRRTLNALIGDRAVPMPQHWPKPYDLHLKPRGPRVDRSMPEPIAAEVWSAWLRDYLASVAPDEAEAGIAPLGEIDDGKAAIAAARELWSARYGEERVLAQAPYRAYRNATRWVVLGDGGSGRLGDGLIAVIERATGRVLRISGESAKPQ